MYRSAPDIYEMLDTLTVEMKEELVEYLKADIAAAKAAPKKSYLEEQWAEIKRLIEVLKYEPYIDDQTEIEEIWNICEDMIKNGKFKKEPWEIRRRVIKSIIGGEYYDYYGVCDPMEDLFNALMFTNEEKVEVADIIFEIGSEFMKADGARLYKECGHQDKYIAFVEQHLKDKEDAYMEVIDYYKDSNPGKAVEIAEIGLKKCKNRQTDIIIFLIKNAMENGDAEREAKLIKSAKMRRSVNYAKVQEALNLYTRAPFVKQASPSSRW